MSKSGTIVRNWAYLLSSSMLSQILGLIAMIRVARMLGPSDYGNYNLIQTTAGIGAVLAGFGMRNVIIRNCARNPEKARGVYFISLLLRAGFWLIASAGIVLYSLNSKSALPLLLCGLVVLISFGQVIWDTTESISFGLQRMGPPSWINSLGSVFWIMLVWLAPASVLTLVFVSSSFALMQIMKSGVFAFQVKRIVAAGAA
jgi:O-antigen/teichoic acid export membrane protein